MILLVAMGWVMEVMASVDCKHSPGDGPDVPCADVVPGEPHSSVTAPTAPAPPH